MQLMPTAQLDQAELSEYGQLKIVRAVMHIIGQELNAEEPLSKGGTFESIYAALSNGADAEPQVWRSPSMWRAMRSPSGSGRGWCGSV